MKKYRCPACKKVGKTDTNRKRDFVVRCSECNKLVRIWRCIEDEDTR